MTHTTSEFAMSGQGSTGNVIAAICSFFLPGLGQLVQGRILKSLLFFVACGVGYGLAIFTLGLSWIGAAVFHLWSIIDAATYKGE